MIQHDERELNLWPEHDAATARAAADLEQVYTTTPAPHLAKSIDRAVYARMSQGTSPAPMHGASKHTRMGRRVTPRLRLASLAAAALLAASSVAGYLRLSGPTPAAADTQRILRRAAAALQLAPNEAVHAVYSVAVDTSGLDANNPKAGSGLTGTADVWVQTDASGAPALSAQTLTTSKSGMASRFIQVGAQVYAYNPEMRGDDTIWINPEARIHPSWLIPRDLFNGASVAQELNTLAARSPQQVHLLPQQTLDGHTVDVIEVDGWTNGPAQRTTFYVDAQSYMLRGFDAASRDPSYPMPSWQVRLGSYAAMPAAAVSPHTFTLDAPATARVARLDLADPVTVASLQASYTAACHAGATVNLKVLLRSAQTLLASCQASAPGTTQAALVAGLAAPSKAAMDAAVAAGQLTPAQEANSLPALATQLTALVTTPPSTLTNPVPTPGTDGKPGA